MGILAWIVIGIIAGWLAGKVTRGGGFGLIGDLIIGVVGALIGGFIASSLLKIPGAISGFNVETLAVAFLGSVLVILVLRLLNGRTRAL